MKQDAALDPAHLRQKHMAAIRSNKHWTEIWDIFYCDPWFQSKLQSFVDRMIRKNRLPADWKDDITQEAVLAFANEIRKRSNLGFDPEKGSYFAFVLTILSRCCAKGTRQFRRILTQTPLEAIELLLTSDVISAEQLIEYRDMIEQLSEPGKTIFWRLATASLSNHLQKNLVDRRERFTAI